MTPMLHGIYDASVRLGLSEYAVRRCVKDGELPYVEIGRRRYIPDDELRPFVARKKQTKLAARKAAVLGH